MTSLSGSECSKGLHGCLSAAPLPMDVCTIPINWPHMITELEHLPYGNVFIRYDAVTVYY